MANRNRVPATRRMPKLELLEIQVRAITIIRDNSGKIIGKGVGDAKEIHSVEEFSTYLEACRKEIAEGNKAK